MATLSSPNRIVWEYFSTLRRLVEEAQNAPSTDICRQNTVLSVFMAVTVTEVFINMWFRVRVENRHSEAEKKAFLKELSFPQPASLDRKLKQWPERYLGGPIDFSSGPGAEFMRLKDLRNSMVHFTSKYETFQYDNVVIHRLADTSSYDGLVSDDALWALQTAEDMVAEIFKKSGADCDRIPHKLHAWTGKFPV
ncbi:MAG: hypothetical protein AB2697_19770 [Candidatus Thiodiazotropha endolucinida]